MRPIVQPAAEDDVDAPWFLCFNLNMYDVLYSITG